MIKNNSNLWQLLAIFINVITVGIAILGISCGSPQSPSSCTVDCSDLHPHHMTKIDIRTYRSISEEECRAKAEELSCKGRFCPSDAQSEQDCYKIR